MSLASFARLLGLRFEDAEPALHSDRVAKLVLSRRCFLGASAALAASTQFSFAPAAALSSVHLVDGSGNILHRWQPGERIAAFTIMPGIGFAELRRVATASPIVRLSKFPGSVLSWMAASPMEVILA